MTEAQNLLEVTRGDSPLVLGLPHTGTRIPDDYLARLNDTGRAMADTDWHIHTLYQGLMPNATSVRTLVHRYVIDVNRDPSGTSLYPGQNTTGLCPTTDFDGRSIYLDGQEPDAAEIERRRIAYHAPYHAALAAELARVKAIHGFALLYDCHSIRSVIPFLFNGTLPDLNIGTNAGTTCAPEIEAIANHLARSSPYSTVLNGRFKGGWTTRQYGQPSQGLHAVQMELAQSTYLSDEAPPWPYDPAKAARLQSWLGHILDAITQTAQELPT